ncbi:hypothetical protein WKH56_07630 [Priestia sp. SB1]|uniref:Uncharacterized protein n=1 Tax=Priestia aryabhattai TaxID=412384 RepID=A0AAX6NFC5_PRIAR|nr:hypothetical protein [Priestia aryabhattai]MDU9694194.1 hypothetical protein [Priestia aryabhattai]
MARFLETKSTAYSFESYGNLLATDKVFGNMTNTSVRHLPTGGYLVRNCVTNNVDAVVVLVKEGDKLMAYHAA